MKINILSDQAFIKISFFNLKNDAHKTLDWEIIIQNTRNRLNVFFASDEYRIQVTGEVDTVIMLNIPLSDNIFQTKLITLVKKQNSLFMSLYNNEGSRCSDCEAITTPKPPIIV